MVSLPQVLTWAKQHQQRLETALSELVANAELLEELLAWIQWAETTLIQRDQEPIPQNIDRVKALIAEHQVRRRILCHCCSLRCSWSPFPLPCVSFLRCCLTYSYRLSSLKHLLFQFLWGRSLGMSLTGSSS